MSNLITNNRGFTIYNVEEKIPIQQPYLLNKKERWKILIVDDEKDIHIVTKLVLSDCSFKNKKLEFISAYSGEEARKLIQEHSDTALILLDVVMEEDDSGLKFLEYLRNELQNKLVRVILTTGQPGKAPQLKVIVDYDINDYKQKTDMTKESYHSSVILALRTFYTLQDLEKKCFELNKQCEATERFVPKIFLDILNKRNIVDVNLADHVEKETTILFLDVRSFTTLSEGITPLETFEFVNNWIQYMEPIIRQHNGFIDKYVGDGILSFFIDKPEDAVMTSIDLLRALVIYNSDRILNHKKPIEMGIGINTGLVVIGVVGFRDRIECTVIGDAVNVAEKIEKCNKIFHTKIVIGEKTFMAIKNSNQFYYRNLGKTDIPGKLEKVHIYEIFNSDPDNVIEQKQKNKEIFEQAIHFYEQGDFVSANQLFRQVYHEDPSDLTAKYFLEKSQ
jgi:adenylate cyclase